MTAEMTPRLIASPLSPEAGDQRQSCLAICTSHNVFSLGPHDHRPRCCPAAPRHAGPAGPRPRGRPDRSPGRHAPSRIKELRSSAAELMTAARCGPRADPRPWNQGRTAIDQQQPGTTPAPPAPPDQVPQELNHFTMQASTSNTAAIYVKEPARSHPAGADAAGRSPRILRRQRTGGRGPVSGPDRKRRGLSEDDGRRHIR